MTHIRPAKLDDAEPITKIHVQAWQESYKDIIDSEYLRNISYENRLDLRRSILTSKTTTCYVVELENQIVGFCDVGTASDGSGELYALYILDAFKRRGLGKLLWEKALSYFTGHGLLPFHAWVLKDNIPARQFYETQGGQLTKELPVKIGDQIYEEVRYTFHSLPL